MASAAKDDKSRSVKRVAVVGAGVSGLAAAYKLKSHGLDVTVFEAHERAGGKLRSVSQDGLIWDEGANTMIESEMEAKALINDLGLEEKQQFPISQHKRYIVRNGRPLLVPTNPVALLTSKLLSSQSKFRVIFEPFMWKKDDPAYVHDEHTEESVGSFFQRHFGKEVVDYLIDPIVAGTSGDPESLYMHYSFPELWNLEKRFGSLIAGALPSKLFVKKEKTGVNKDALENKKPKRGSFSFYGGMQTLTDTLSKELGKDNLKLNTEVLSLSYCHGGSSLSDMWSITCSSNQDTQVVDAVVKTAPLSNVKDMKITNRGNRFPLDFLPEVTYMPLSVIITTFKTENVKRPLEGFGVLVSSNEQHGFKTLGTLFSSMMFPDRAPSNSYLYTTFIGGSRNRELAQASTDELKQVVTSDLRKLLGAEGEPTFVNHFYWSKAFPLYGHNYGSVLEAIDKLEKNLPGFFYAGNHEDGLSVGKSIASGCKAADLVISYLNSASDDAVPSDYQMTAIVILDFTSLRLLFSILLYMISLFQLLLNKVRIVYSHAGLGQGCGNLMQRESSTQKQKGEKKEEKWAHQCLSSPSPKRAKNKRKKNLVLCLFLRHFNEA